MCTKKPVDPGGWKGGRYGGVEVAQSGCRWCLELTFVTTDLV